MLIIYWPNDINWYLMKYIWEIKELHFRCSNLMCTVRKISCWLTWRMTEKWISVSFIIIFVAIFWMLSKFQIVFFLVQEVLSFAENHFYLHIEMRGAYSKSFLYCIVSYCGAVLDKIVHLFLKFFKVKFIVIFALKLIY